MALTTTISFPKDRIRAAVMGAGHWGCKLVREFDTLDSVELAWVVDPDPEARAKAHSIAPSAKTAEHISSALRDVQLVAVCTPARNHVEHVRDLLASRKDVLVEKPFAMRTKDAVSLAVESQDAESILMVGHQLLFHPVFCKLKSLIREGVLGRLLAVTAERTGVVDLDREPGVLWSYGPHDVAMILALAGEMPDQVATSGTMPTNDVESVKVADVALSFPSGLQAEIHLSATDTMRRRRLVAIGDRRVAVFDDAIPGGSLLLVDGSTDYRHDFSLLKDGDRSSVQVMDIQPGESLTLECAHFAHCVQNRSKPLTGPDHAVAVTQVLDAAASCLAS
ncbi:MAG: Gfo/Idh/MocA family oxidoreductase [Proteobacteria bacterium]|nr:Gfo/Idh/MocA family oxidoreductase [Pseudomonadota bacterium]